MLRFDKMTDAAEAARMVIEDRELRAREPRILVRRTILLVYQDGQLLNAHHLPAGVEPPPLVEATEDPVRPGAASQAYLAAWEEHDEGAAAHVA